VTASLVNRYASFEKLTAMDLVVISRDIPPLPDLC